MRAEENTSPSLSPATPATLSPAEELALLQQNLTLNDSTVCRWNLGDGSLIWAGNAQQALAQSTALPTHIDGWIALLPTADRKRYEQLKNSLTRHDREVDMEYELHNPQGAPVVRIRQIGRVVQEQKQKFLLSTLMYSHAPSEEEAAGDESIAYLTHEIADRRAHDRRSYHYPPAFMKQLHKAISHSVETGEQGAFMLLAINNLAMIINAYGFGASERALSDIRHAIAATLGAHDSVERIHRDQLGVVLADCDRETAEKRAREFKSLIQRLTLEHDGGPLHITCSIGSVGFPDPATTVTEALDKAYVALHNNSHLAFRAFEDDDHDSEKSREQMAIANCLHDAIVENRLRLAFQPIIRSKTGKVGHYESLLRIVDKDGKISSAGPLIPVAERMGLIEIIDRLVVEKVVEELRQHPTVELAFNISSVTTGNPEWLRYLSSLLNDDLSIASRMIVEITETAAQRDLRETAYFVASLQALGCQVSLDDFGSGYTSFRQLKALSVDMLKIDGAFIRDIVDNADNRFFVKTLLDFTNGYGLHTVAEFVETGEVAKVLMEMGVEYMQGYYFSPPLNYRPWLNEGEYQPE